MQPNDTNGSRPPAERPFGVLLVVACAAACAALAWAESRRPLRVRTEERARRVARNLAIAALAAIATQRVERPLVLPLAERVAARGWGLVPWLGLRGRAADVAALLLLDYTLFVWHVLTHRSAFLWRFHAVHHADRDLDASTALRFHFGEMLLSIPWRAAQIAVIGVAPQQLATWQRALLASIIFHHSNWRLPVRVENVLSRLVMTPRLHGIHHSDRADERASNWSSGLVVWDWLHGSMRRDVPQTALRIGIQGLNDPEQVALAPMLALPFVPDAHRLVGP